MAKNRGLYNQDDGSSKRGGKDSNAAFLSEVYADNEAVEQHEVDTLKRMFKEQNWKQFNDYVAELVAKGFSRSRVDSIIARATSGIKV